MIARLTLPICPLRSKASNTMERVSVRAVSIADSITYAFGRSPVKEALAEFLATFILVLLGDGVMASCVLGRLNLNSTLVGAFGWGFAVMVAVSISGGVSGGHVNPAVTVALASVKKCPLKNVVPYVTAQYTASFLAAAVVYFTYVDAINLYDGGVRQIPPSTNATAQIFATYSQDFASVFTCFLDQVVGTAILLILICAATDQRNLRVPPHTQPMIIGLAITAILLAFGHNCGAPLNPARDFGPRFFTAIAGWGSSVFSYRNYKWFWIPVLAPHLGGILGVWLYKLFIELPFQNYRLLQEIETPDEERKTRSELDLNLPEPPLERSVSSDGVCKEALEKVVSDGDKLATNDKPSAVSDKILDAVNVV